MIIYSKQSTLGYPHTMHSRSDPMETAWEPATAEAKTWDDSTTRQPNPMVVGIILLNVY